MNLKIKKLIAREFLIIVGTILCVGLFYSILLIRNLYLNNQIIKSKYEIASITKEIESLENQYQIYDDLVEIPVKRREPPNGAKRWEPPKDDIIIDTIPEKVNDSNDPLGLEKALREKKLKLENRKKATNQSIDSLNNLTSKLNQKNIEVRTKSSKILSQDEILSTMTIFLIIILSILYPIRFLGQSIIWAIKTLKI